MDLLKLLEEEIRAVPGVQGVQAKRHPRSIEYEEEGTLQRILGFIDVEFEEPSAPKSVLNKFFSVLGFSERKAYDLKALYHRIRPALAQHTVFFRMDDRGAEYSSPVALDPAGLHAEEVVKVLRLDGPALTIEDLEETIYEAGNYWE